MAAVETARTVQATDSQPVNSSRRGPADPDVAQHGQREREDPVLGAERESQVVGEEEELGQQREQGDAPDGRLELVDLSAHDGEPGEARGGWW